MGVIFESVADAGSLGDGKSPFEFGLGVRRGGTARGSFAGAREVLLLGPGVLVLSSLSLGFSSKVARFPGVSVA